LLAQLPLARTGFSPTGVISRPAEDPVGQYILLLAKSRDSSLSRYLRPSADILTRGDSTETGSRKTHVLVGGITGGVVVGGLAFLLTQGCDANSPKIGPSCAAGKDFVVIVAALGGILAGTLVGYLWPAGANP
jgi:hypothetical protein